MLDRLIDLVHGWMFQPELAIFKGGGGPPPPPPPPPPPAKAGVFEEGLYDEEDETGKGRRKGAYGALVIPRPAQGAGPYGGSSA